MKLLTSILFLLFAVNCLALDLKPSAQAKLMTALLSRSNLEFADELRFVIIDPSSASFSQELHKVMSSSSSIQIGGKSLKFLVELASDSPTEAQPSTVYYYVNDIQAVPEKLICFSNVVSNLEKGCFSSLTMEGTTPKVHMSLEKMKELGLSFPSKLMKMVTLIK